MKFLTRLLTFLTLLLTACAPVIKPRAVSPTDTAPATVTPTGTPTVTPFPTPHIAQVTAYQSLHVRVRPGEHQPVPVGDVPRGSVVLTDHNGQRAVWLDGKLYQKARKHDSHHRS